MPVRRCHFLQNVPKPFPGIRNEIGWAFGLGLERIAMVLFQIPDIRLFWSTDERFIDQFQPGKISVFKPYSKYPPTVHDISFWFPLVPKEGQPLHENDFCDIVREVAGDIVEDVTLVRHFRYISDMLPRSSQVDDFAHPKTGRRSQCYRIIYRSMDRYGTFSVLNRIVHSQPIHAGRYLTRRSTR